MTDWAPFLYTTGSGVS